MRLFFFLFFLFFFFFSIFVAYSMVLGRLQFLSSDNTYERYPGVLAVELGGVNIQQLDLSEFDMLFIFTDEKHEYIYAKKQNIVERLHSC